ncbi:MAG: amino acid ABC transporter permease [Caldilineaceae bacterium]|nr:amino acid ABC transporter permease [Caldilineaceae bacterium]
MTPNWLTPDLLNLLLQGLLLTVVLTAVTAALALVLGVAAGTMRISGNRLAGALAVLHVETHRNLPALVLMIIWAFALPNLFPTELRRPIFFDNAFLNWLSSWSGLSLPYYTLAAGVALVLNTSAYLAELFRAGVGAIPQQHVDAARTLGASRLKLFWTVLLPQGLRTAFPAISTRLIHHLKNTALAAFVATPEFFHSAQTAITRTFLALEFLMLAAIVYLLLAFAFSGLLRWVEKQWLVAGG